MASPIEIVSAFLAEGVKGRDAIRAAIRASFTPQTVWENVGMATTVGPEEAIGLMDVFEAKLSAWAVDAEVHTICASGNMVLTERTDHLVSIDGNRFHSTPCMGAFEVVDGKIVGWRDYFDTNRFPQG